MRRERSSSRPDCHRRAGSYSLETENSCPGCGAGRGSFACEAGQRETAHFFTAALSAS
jgi:hypothetical protein